MNALGNFDFRGPWFTSREAQAYVCCASLKAWYQWRKRHGIVCRGNGTVAKVDLDRALKVGRKRQVMHAASLANLQKGRPRGGEAKAQIA